MGRAKNQIFEGIEIYDWDGVKIGKVVKYDAKLGYLQTEGTFSGPRYIPFSALERVGPSGAYLNVSYELVKELYHHAPKVTPTLDTSGKLTGGGTVASGYTGRPVPLDADGIRLVREKVTKGSRVFDVEGKKLGTVQMYDGESGYMRIDKGEVFTKEIFLPVTAVSYLDDTGIHLAQSKDSIVTHFARVPDVAQDIFAR